MSSEVKNSLPDCWVDLGRKTKSPALANSSVSNHGKQILHQQEVTKGLKLEEMLRSGQHLKLQNGDHGASIPEHTGSVTPSCQTLTTSTHQLSSEPPLLKCHLSGLGLSPALLRTRCGHSCLPT